MAEKDTEGNTKKEGGEEVQVAQGGSEEKEKKMCQQDYDDEDIQMVAVVKTNVHDARKDVERTAAALHWEPHPKSIEYQRIQKKRRDEANQKTKFSETQENKDQATTEEDQGREEGIGEKDGEKSTQRLRVEEVPGEQGEGDTVAPSEGEGGEKEGHEAERSVAEGGGEEAVTEKKREELAQKKKTRKRKLVDEEKEIQREMAKVNAELATWQQRIGEKLEQVRIREGELKRCEDSIQVEERAVARLVTLVRETRGQSDISVAEARASEVAIEEMEGKIADLEKELEKLEAQLRK